MEDRYLFKAKHFEEWHIGNIVKETDGLYIRDIKENVMAYIDDESTICQCTGLKDKNGNLIWENDIIHKPFYTDYDACANSEAYTGRIQYEDGGWSIEIIKFDGNVCVSPIIDMIAYSKDIEHFEVIGNTFDNKELLESEEK